MYLNEKYSIVLLILSFKIRGFISIRNEVLPSKKDRVDGIFVGFLRNFLDLLTTTFPQKRLPKYMRVLHYYLSELEFRYAQKLAKHVKYLSRMHYEDIWYELKDYREQLDNKLPHRTVFLEAMDEAFTLREHILFNDYIYELRNFGNEDIIVIDDETKKLLNDVIVGRILKLSPKDQTNLFKKLKKAYKEYD